MASRDLTSWPPYPRAGQLRSDWTLQFALLTAASAALVAYALVTGQRLFAVIMSLVPLGLWTVIRPVALLVPLGVSIPDLQSLTGGRWGFNLSISDVLLLLLAAGIATEGAMTKSLPAVRALRPVLASVLQYVGVMAFLLFFHSGIGNFAKTGQRFELFLLPLIVGAYAALKGRHIALLQGYIVSATVLAVVWPLHDFGMQKNPVGQVIANAILLLIGVQRLRRMLPCLLILVPGLFLTESRGAIIATAIGIVVLAIMQGFRNRSVLTRAFALGVLAVAIFAVMPPTLQARVTTLTASQNSRAGWALYFRNEYYYKDAKRIINDHRWTGVGIGNYVKADSSSSLPAADPHQVILLQAAEGGYILAASFVLLFGGVMLALRRMTQVDVAIAAAAVLAATVAHGFVDIYWVRGTPVLGWLLVGMACGALASQRKTVQP